MTIRELIQGTEQHVVQLFDTLLPPNLHYHQLKHTRGVVKAAASMSAYYQLSDEDTGVLQIAAWLHDIGYLYGPWQVHEETGAEKAEELLSGFGADSDFIEKVKGCIRATKMPQQPQGQLQEIMCDADLQHLGSPDYKEIIKELRQELQECNIKKTDDISWIKENIDFLKQHKYFTSYGQLFLEPGVAINITKLEKRLNKKEENEKEQAAEESANKEEKADEGAGKGIKKGANYDKINSAHEKAIDTTLRIMSNNHIHLSSMADSKAHIMISVNAIMASVIVSLVTDQISKNPKLIFPVVVSLCFSVVTVVFAILATRPNVGNGKFVREDIESKKTNLLFFGNFFQMKPEEYDWAMNELLQDRSFLHSSVIRDVYNQGVVLARKYKLLRIAYNTFMVGFAVSILAFIYTMIILS